MLRRDRPFEALNAGAVVIVKVGASLIAVTKQLPIRSLLIVEALQMMTLFSRSNLYLL
jgi:hypothetical protein